MSLKIFKNLYSRNLARLGLASFLALLLAACNSGSSGGPGIGHLSLGITDAPVDGAEKVVVQFTGVEIQPANGPRITIDYDSPKTIDLLALQGGLRDTLLNGAVLDAGKYSWIRLKLNAVADGVLDSYIQINGAQYELNIPSGAQTGLKLNTPFTVADGDNLDFTIDFNLRQSVHQPDGHQYMGVPVYYLRPTLRLVDTKETGVISGQIDPAVFSELSCSNNTAGYAVYLFKGDVTPDDIDSVEPDPVTTALATLNSSSQYVYKLSFLQPGDYTIAATCAADVDQPDVDDDIPNVVNDVPFVGQDMVSVTARATTQHNFVPLVP